MANVEHFDYAIYTTTAFSSSQVLLREPDIKHEVHDYEWFERQAEKAARKANLQGYVVLVGLILVGLVTYFLM